LNSGNLQLKLLQAEGVIQTHLLTLHLQLHFLELEFLQALFNLRLHSSLVTICCGMQILVCLTSAFACAQAEQFVEHVHGLKARPKEFRALVITSNTWKAALS